MSTEHAAAPAAPANAADDGALPIREAGARPAHTRTARWMSVLHVAREEWRHLVRGRIALPGLLLLGLLTGVAGVMAWDHLDRSSAERAHYQAQANAAFNAQPDRHPHRVAHYGHFLFRPLSPLALFDPGVDRYTGHTVFLEAHRQNSANFSDVRQSSLLLRFGQFAPAFVLQVLAPLLLIVAGHATFARERESGTLRLLLAQGVRPRELVTGKLLALLGLATLTLLPMALGALWLGAQRAADGLTLAWLLGGYGLWLTLWVLLVMLASLHMRSARDALLALLAAWCLLVILVPRGMPVLADSLAALPTRFAQDIDVQRDYLALGDSHNPNDPKFAAFRAQVLQQYGVDRVEDLPVNFKGLVGAEGERRSSALFARYAQAAQAQQNQQVELLQAAGWISPALALHQLSSTLSGTDLTQAVAFEAQAEAYRYAFVQTMNRLQTETLTYRDDTDPTRSNRIAHTHWQAFPPFVYQPEPAAQVRGRAWPAFAPLILWLALAAGLLSLATLRAGRRPA